MGRAKALVRGAATLTATALARLQWPARERTVRQLAFALLIAGVMMPVAARGDDLVEERVYLRVKIKEQTVRLEAIFVKRANAQGRLPIAFYHHGRPGTHQESLEQRLDGLAQSIARDFARRGWLGVAINRRGFGLSDGAVQVDNHLPCEKFNQKDIFNADADDIEATLPLIATRPDADLTRIISIGHSAGGGTSIELGARNLGGLRLVVNIAGGYSRGSVNQCELTETIRRDFRELGARSRVPQLWFFADNDPLHPPGEPELMRSSFAGGGGNVQLKMTGPLGDNGHLGLIALTGRNLWLAEIDARLRALGLPTWPLSNVDIVMQRMRIPESSRKVAESYLSMAGEVAFARSTRTGSAVFAQGVTMQAARASALKSCEASNPPCAIVMENERWVGN